MGLLKKAPLFIVGFLAYFGAMYYFGGGDELKSFEVFESVEGRFSVSMPGELKKETKSIATPVGDMGITLFSAGSKKSQFVVCYCDYSKDFYDGSNPEKMLDVATQGAVADCNGQLLTEEKLDNYGSPAREVKIKVSGKGIVTARLILNGQRLYQVMTMLPFDWQDEGKMAEFFDSFKMHKK